MVGGGLYLALGECFNAKFPMLYLGCRVWHAGLTPGSPCTVFSTRGLVLRKSRRYSRIVCNQFISCLRGFRYLLCTCVMMGESIID